MSSARRDLAYSMLSAEWRKEHGIVRSYPVWNHPGYAPAYEEPYRLNVAGRFENLNLQYSPNVSP